MSQEQAALEWLASLYSVETSFWDPVNHRVRQAAPETLLGVLRALGAPVERMGDAAAAGRARLQEIWRRAASPVAVAWDGTSAGVELRLPASCSDSAVACALRLESGEERRWVAELAGVAAEEASEVEGERFVRKRLPLPGGLPWGYHRLTAEIAGKPHEILVISSPAHAYLPPGGADHRWGVFLPLYALRSERDWGVGDFGDLDMLMRWVGELGGNIVATLPLLACYLDEPFEPSPYSPVSRLFWNELYLDVPRSPEFEHCRPARALVASASFRRQVKSLRRASLVDYRRAMSLKRQALEKLVKCLHARRGERLAAFERYVEAHPILQDYARFRAAMERQRRPWTAWPARLRDGDLRPGDYAEDARLYHLYAQWQAHEQITALCGGGRSNGVELYFDLPLGVHQAGYDAWRHREVFALEASAGAPPDPVFTSGQDWTFAPLHPERLREQGYRYVVHTLRHAMEQARLLRIDHVMGLHRLFWIPRGAAPGEGAYVHYRAEELYAILTLESQRNHCAVIGENLGIVPDYVNPTMSHHHLLKMWIMQFELQSDPRAAIRPPAADQLAGLNTHDMYPLAAYWSGEDIRARHRLRLLRPDGARRERADRAAIIEAVGMFLWQDGWLPRPSGKPTDIFAGAARFLASSRAPIVVFNLEDAWGERRPQNVPGSGRRHPNWRRKARFRLEELRRQSAVVELLGEISRCRRSAGVAG